MISDCYGRKKKYLKEFRSLVKEIDELQKDIDDLFEKETEIKVDYSGMPKASDHHDLSDYAGEYHELWTEMEKEKTKKLHHHLKIFKGIRCLEDVDERRILNLCYLKGFSVSKTAEEMGYSIRQVIRIRKQAIENLKIN